jgi:hypothetical protein
MANFPLWEHSPKWDDDIGMVRWMSDVFTGYSLRLLPYEPEIVKTAQAKRGAGGRPKMTLEERREQNPVHDAAALFPEVVIELQNAFPEKTTAVIRDRALELTALFMGIKSKGKQSESEQLKNYLNRSRNDRRRID